MRYRVPATFHIFSHSLVSNLFIIRTHLQLVEAPDQTNYNTLEGVWLAGSRVGCIRPNYHDQNPRNFKPLEVVKRLASIPRNPLKNIHILFMQLFLGQYYYYNNYYLFDHYKQTKVTK